MTPFRFRLDRVLRLRRGLERARAGELGAALGAEAARRDELAAAEQRLEKTGRQADAAPPEPTAAGTLQARSDALQAAAERVREAEARAETAERLTDAERDRFRAARRDRETLERLRELRQADWKIESARGEQKDVDEVARRRLGPGGKS